MKLEPLENSINIDVYRYYFSIPSSLLSVLCLCVFSTIGVVGYVINLFVLIFKAFWCLVTYYYYYFISIPVLMGSPEPYNHSGHTLADKLMEQDLSYTEVGIMLESENTRQTLPQV